MQKAGICRYFQKGNCRLRGNCPYVHKKELRAKCKFFMEGYCKFGDNCNFYHPPKKQATQGIAQDGQLDKREVKKEDVLKEPPIIPKQMSEQKKIDKISAINSLLGVKVEQAQLSKPATILPVEINYAKRIEVSFKDLARTPQGKQNTQRINAQVYKKPYLEYLKQITDPLLRDQAQIMRRYQYSFVQTQPNKFTLKLSPIIDSKFLRLNFDIEEKCLQIKGCLKPMNLEIVNKSIPEYFKQQLNSHLVTLMKVRTPYETLKYLENYFEKVCDQVDFMLQNRKFNQNELEYGYDDEYEEVESEEEKNEQPIVKKQPINQIQKIQQKQGQLINDAQLQERQSAEQHKQDEGEPRQQKKQKIKNEIPEQIELPISVTLQTLETNCESLTLEELLIHLVCSCTAMITFCVRAKAKKPLSICSRLKCFKCRQLITIYTKRQILHRGNNFKLADMACINAKLAEAGAIAWKVNCECENVIISDQLALSGVKKIIKCFECFKEYYVQYYGLFAGIDDEFFPKGPKIQKAKRSNELIFKLDSELPEKGACKHYKYSFRWLRFQCCGRAFPCDKCHESNTERHDYDRAEVMICGFCSYEQPVLLNCKRCKKDLVKGTEKSGHWEGGKGCRDQTKLSKNDPKKYTGLSKTQANKHGSK